jgi:hypothetical protein
LTLGIETEEVHSDSGYVRQCHFKVFAAQSLVVGIAVGSSWGEKFGVEKVVLPYIGDIHIDIVEAKKGHLGGKGQANWHKNFHRKLSRT